MEKEAFFDVLKSGRRIIPTNIYRQHWRREKYLGNSSKPRGDFAILMILRGSAEFKCLSHTLYAKQGNLVVLPKGSIYETSFPEQTDDYIVTFDIDGYTPDSPSPMLLLESAPLTLHERFRNLVNEKYSADHTELKSCGLLYILLDSLVRSSEMSGTGRAIAEIAKKMIDENITAETKEIIRVCAVSESTLRRAFKEYTGITITEYRTETKLRRAMYLLESTDKTVGEIAEELRFFDAAYFCRFFRSHTGMTPKQYADKRRI